MFILAGSGLLHYVSKTLETIPGHCQPFVIGIRLEKDEENWLGGQNVGHFNSKSLVDANSVFEWLLNSIHCDFVWLDADCWVYQDDWWSQLTESEPGVSVSGLWTNGSPSHLIPHRHNQLLRTHCLAVYRDAVEAGLKAFPDLSPGTYSFHPTRAPRLAPGERSNLITEPLRAALGKVLQLGVTGRPERPEPGMLDVYADGTYDDAITLRRPGRLFSVFDTMQMYQYVLFSLGYRTRLISPQHQGVNAAAVHIGGIGHLLERRLLQGETSLHTVCEYLLVREFARNTSISLYQARASRVSKLLPGLTHQAAIRLLRRACEPHNLDFRLIMKG